MLKVATALGRENIDTSSPATAMEADDGEIEDLGRDGREQ